GANATDASRRFARQRAPTVGESSCRSVLGLVANASLQEANPAGRRRFARKRVPTWGAFPVGATSAANSAVAEDDRRHHSGASKLIFTASALRCAGPWYTASMLLPSGSSTKAA